MQPIKTILKRSLDRLPRPASRMLRALWRRLPPRDPRFMLQSLETARAREALFNSPHYARFVEREIAHWTSESQSAGRAPENSSTAGKVRFRQFLAHPVVREAVQRRACPETGDVWKWMAKSYPGRKEALVLGAGRGDQCRLLIDRRIASKVRAIDLAPDVVERAATEFRSLGYPIDYEVGDMNFMRFPAGSFDLCLAMHALHHIINLELLFQRLAGSLAASRGVLIVEEYVGPRFMEYPLSVREAVQRWMTRLPPRLRKSPGGGEMDSIWFPDRWWVQSRSPFESIRSDRIIQVLDSAFRIDFTRPLGGGLIAPLLSAIIQNFDPESAEDNAWLTRILQDDLALTEAGEIPNFFVFLVATPRG